MRAGKGGGEKRTGREGSRGRGAPALMVNQVGNHKGSHNQLTHPPFPFPPSPLSPPPPPSHSSRPFFAADHVARDEPFLPSTDLQAHMLPPPLPTGPTRDNNLVCRWGGRVPARCVAD